MLCWNVSTCKSVLWYVCYSTVDVFIFKTVWYLIKTSIIRYFCYFEVNWFQRLVPPSTFYKKFNVNFYVQCTLRYTIFLNVFSSWSIDFCLVGPEKFKTKVINNSVNPEWNEVFEVSKEALKVQGMYEAWSAVQARSQKILIPQFKLMQVLLSKQFSEKASDITERWYG